MSNDIMSCSMMRGKNYGWTKKVKSLDKKWRIFGLKKMMEKKIYINDDLGKWMNKRWIVKNIKKFPVRYYLGKY